MSADGKFWGEQMLLQKKVELALMRANQDLESYNAKMVMMLEKADELAEAAINTTQFYGMGEFDIRINALSDALAAYRRAREWK